MRDVRPEEVVHYLRAPVQRRRQGHQDPQSHGMHGLVPQEARELGRPKVHEGTVTVKQPKLRKERDELQT